MTQGKLLKWKNLSEDIKVKGKTTYIYDVNGNLSEKNHGLIRMGLSSRKSFCLLTTRAYFQNSVWSKVKLSGIFVLNEKTEKVIEETSLRDGTKFYCKYTYAYDERGNKTEMHWYKRPDKLSMSWNTNTITIQRQLDEASSIQRKQSDQYYGEKYSVYMKMFGLSFSSFIIRINYCWLSKWTLNQKLS